MAGRQGRRRFGAIRRLPSGRYQVRYRTLDGRDVTAPTTFATKADAGRYLAKVEADRLRGEWADPRLGRTTFGEWADRWLDSTMNLRANTKAGYRTILRQHLRPAFQSYPLASIDVLAIRTWLARLEAEGVGQATRAKAYRLLARILGAAVEARYLAVNPCSIRGAASDGTSEMQIATVEQVAAIAEQLPGRYRALVLVAAFGGLRWGELVGLRRKRIDLERGTVTVAEQLVEVNGAFSVGPPKSLAGRRIVTLPAAVVEALAEHLDNYTPKSPDAFVFPVARTGTCGAATSTAGSGSRPPGPPGSRGYASMTCGTPPAPWPRPPAAPCARSWTGWATRPPWRPCATSTLWLTGTPPSPGS
jgi:integrase